jgi:putative heme transporter
MPTAEAGGQAPRHRTRRVVLAGVLAALLLTELVAVVPYIDRTGSSLRHPNLSWLVAAITVELASMAAFAHMQHRMFRAAGGRVSIRKIVAMSYAANAVSMTLPAGAAVSSGYTFRRLRAWGASVPSASFTLISSGVLSTSSFGLIAAVAALAFGATQGSPVLLVMSVLVMAGVIGALRWLSHRRQLSVRVGKGLLSVVNRLRHRQVDTGLAVVYKFFGDLSAIRPRARDWALGLGLATSSWAADLLCLFACAKAIGLDRATLALIVATFLAGTSVSGLSVVPAGLGIVDAAMVLTLSRGGVPVATAAAVVLLYRLISLAFIVAIGWTVWLHTWRHDSHETTHTTRTQQPFRLLRRARPQFWRRDTLTKRREESRGPVGSQAQPRSDHASPTSGSVVHAARYSRPLIIALVGGPPRGATGTRSSNRGVSREERLS